LLLFILPHILFSQTRFSLSSDASLLRNFKEGQKFWAFGQDLVFDWSFTRFGGAYAWISYYSNGNFTNSLSATAKSPNTSPQEIAFTNKGQMHMEQVSFGFKHYFVGTIDAEPGQWSLYSITGFGLIFGKITNKYSTTIDTSLYHAPEQPISGVGHFKRLTLDLGIGWEIPLATELYFYSEGKVWIPTSDYPSPYLLVNENAPLCGMITAGIRILF
jgi:hypothetical protein